MQEIPQHGGFHEPLPPRYRSFDFRMGTSLLFLTHPLSNAGDQEGRPKLARNTRKLTGSLILKHGIIAWLF